VSTDAGSPAARDEVPLPSELWYRHVARLQRESYSTLVGAYERDEQRRVAWAEHWLRPVLPYVGRAGRPRSAVRVLDLGSGIGHFSEYFAVRGFDVHALDLARDMADRTRRRLRPVYGTETDQRVTWADFMDHDFGQARFDLILGVAFLHCIPRPVDVLAARKIAGLLAADGVAYLTTTAEQRSEGGFALKDAIRGEPQGVLVQRYRTRYTPPQFIETIRAGGLVPWTVPPGGRPVELDASSPPGVLPIVPDTHVRGKRWVDVVATRHGVRLPEVGPVAQAVRQSPPQTHPAPGVPVPVG